MKRSAIFLGIPLILTASIAWGQAIEPRPVAPRQPEGQISLEVQEYQRLPKSGPVAKRLSAFQSFVDRYPGTQLSLRVIRDAAIFFILQDTGNDLESLGECVQWMGKHLESPAFEWARYRQASDSLILDRIETHVLYARVLASYADAISMGGAAERSAGVYNRALTVLNEAQTEWDNHPNFYRLRSDLAEGIDFTRAWCLHGKGNYRDALRGYTNFLDRFPSSDFVPAALWNASQCLQVLDPSGSQQRMSFYHQRLEEEFPGSPETAMLRSLRNSR